MAKKFGELHARLSPEAQGRARAKAQRMVAELLLGTPRLQAVDAGLVERIRALIGDLEVDLDAPLPADDSELP